MKVNKEDIEALLPMVGYMSTKERKSFLKAVREFEINEARSNYFEYVKYTNPDFKELNHSIFLCEVINKALVKREQMLLGNIPQENQYIMVSMPPRHGKSMTITETLPGYFMCKYPKSKVILTAYSSTLANDFAKANSRKLEERNIFEVGVLTDNQDRTEYSNNSVCVKAGILGGITGKGANLMIIDDPIKTAEEARSEVHRDKIWKEWTMSLSTRFEPPTIVILIMTRWHEDDLAGRLLNPQYGQVLPWKVVNLPLEAEKNDILGRKQGEPLWPERYGYNFIKERKQYTESFNALYQGRPSSEEGNMLKRDWWKWYNELPQMVSKIMSVDATFKDGTKNDFVSIQVWGKRDANMYLIDMITARMDFPTTIQAIKNMRNKHKDTQAIYIEDKANGSAIIQVLKQKIGGVIPITPRESKEARVSAISPQIEAGNVYLPQNKSWVNDFVEQCASFPKGANDDMVDCMSQAVNMLRNKDATIIDEEEIDPDELTPQQKHKQMVKDMTGGTVPQTFFKW